MVCRIKTLTTLTLLGSCFLFSFLFSLINRFSLNSLLFDLEIDGRRISEILSNLATSEVGPFREDGRCGVGWEGPNGEPEAACDPG